MPKQARNQTEGGAIECPRCRVGVYPDNAMLFGSAHVQVRDKECSYFVKAKEYTTECRYVTGPRDGFLSVTENPCPYVKEAIGSVWRAVA
jgi:hypothetical protein